MRKSWRRNSRMVALVLLVVALIAASCGDDDDDDAAWSLSECDDPKPLSHEETPRTVPDVIVVDLATAPGEAAEIVGSGSVELIDLTIGLHDFPDGFDGDRYREILPEQPFWNAVDGRVEAFRVASDDRDLLLLALDDAGFEAAPLHLVGYLGHWSAYPGTAPVRCVLEGELPMAEPGDGPTIGVIDTGLVPGSPSASSAVDPADDLHMAGCDDVSHGEFVAEMIRHTDPSATIVSANAFRVTGGECWETTELQITSATSEVLAATLGQDGDLDALNYSLGAVGYEVVDENGDPRVFEPLLTRISFEILLGQLAETDTLVYAAAGNSETDEPISPAVLEGVISVAASDANDNPVVWDENGTAIDFVGSEDPDLIAPGCDLVAVASGAGQPEVVVWSGSSFASPLAAAILADNDIDQDDVDLVMPAGSPIGSQCNEE